MWNARGVATPQRTGRASLSLRMQQPGPVQSIGGSGLHHQDRFHVLTTSVMGTDVQHTASRAPIPDGNNTVADDAA